MQSEIHIDEGVLTRLGDVRFFPMQLRASASGWAVIGQPSGAVAVGGGGNLVMRLVRADARRVARQMTENAHCTVTYGDAGRKF